MKNNYFGSLQIVHNEICEKLLHFRVFYAIIFEHGNLMSKDPKGCRPTLNVERVILGEQIRFEIG